jgi:hypothetical protein
MDKVQKILGYSLLLYPIFYQAVMADNFDYNTPLLSPFYKENNPSFIVYNNPDYPKEHQVKHKDFRYIKTDPRGLGNIIDFYSILEGVKINVAIGKLHKEIVTGEIYQKYKKAGHTIITEKEKVELIVIAKENYSKQFERVFSTNWGIEKNTMTMYNVEEVECFELNKRLVIPKKQEIVVNYPIFKENKIYKPFEKNSLIKWCSGYSKSYVEGMVKLKNVGIGNRKVAIITKAMKEVLFFQQHYGIDAFCANSESIMLSEKVIEFLVKNYDKVYIALDRDRTGIEMMDKYYEKYKLPIILFPAKNITDYYEETKNLDFLTNFI